MKIIILAGGRGTRLWPLSRKATPKQFLKLNGPLSLLQTTVKRFLKWPISDIFVVTNQDYFPLAQKQLSVLDPRLTEQLIVEPEGKNTAPAVALALKFLEKRMGKKEPFLISSSDYLIFEEAHFLRAIHFAEEIAKKDCLVLFGVKPTRPETGYGYIKVKKTDDERLLKAERFVEKPSLKTAKKYLLSKAYVWNSGLFASNAKSFWQELKFHAPDIYELCRGSYAHLVENFSKMPNQSIDYAVMEKSKNISVIPLDCIWSDVGSWDSLYNTLDKDEDQNVKIGNIIDIDTKNSLIIGGEKMISTIGLEDMIIVEAEDAIFIGKRGESQKVKALVEAFKNRKD